MEAGAQWPAKRRAVPTAAVCSPESVELRQGNPESSPPHCPLWFCSAAGVIGKWRGSQTLRIPQICGTSHPDWGHLAQAADSQVLLCCDPRQPPGPPQTQPFSVTSLVCSLRCPERPASTCPETPKCPASWWARAPASPLSEASGSSGNSISSTKVGPGPEATPFPAPGPEGPPGSPARRCVTASSPTARRPGRAGQPSSGLTHGVIPRTCPNTSSAQLRRGPEIPHFSAGR